MQGPPPPLPNLSSGLDGELHDGVDDVAVVPLERRDGLGAGAAGLVRVEGYACMLGFR